MNGFGSTVDANERFEEEQKVLDYIAEDNAEAVNEQLQKWAMVMVGWKQEMDRRGEVIHNLVTKVQSLEQQVGLLRAQIAGTTVGVGLGPTTTLDDG